ncbi:MAG: HAMP domain-containing protein [Xanthobacteraceae bacterium]|nr:HAMP domain-containing protein [Xanthobacteraceae bacterium]MBV9629467.1 HAMP domain-containing protein [Xanthobacteraceae bacterium]
MTALAKLLRATAFRLTLVYLLVFALFAAFLLGYFALNTRRLITEEITSTVDAEITGLAEQYNQGGIRRLVFVIETRSRRPGSSLYLVTTPSGEGLAGNIGSLVPGVLAKPGWMETAYRRLEDPETAEHHALVRVLQLPGGFRLLVGRDLEERERLFDIIATAGRWSVAIVIILGVAGGVFVSRRVLNRVDAMTLTAQTIMAGDLSGRLPIAGSGDELDRLASNLNAMLERIEALMRGLKEVSDNVAHDLRTPLTRLRNRAEEALRTAKDEPGYRSALEATIEESDGLISTFNALLMIARAESGEARENMSEFDAAEVAQDVSELYEPLADTKGLALRVEATPAPVKGNRELVSQALANLVDNAIKYAEPQGHAANGTPAEILVTAGSEGDRIKLAVRDGGPGIPESDRAHAIERFVRLEQSRTKPGSGLGLSLAAAVARLHGGELKLEDNAPGLKAVLDLPRFAA